MKRLRTPQIYRIFYFPKAHDGVQEVMRQIALAPLEEGTSVFKLTPDPEMPYAPKGRVRWTKSLCRRLGAKTWAP